MRRDPALLSMINNIRPHIIGIWESSPKCNKPTIMAWRVQLFSNYLIEEIVWPGSDQARVSMIIFIDVARTYIYPRIANNFQVQQIQPWVFNAKITHIHKSFLIYFTS